MALGTPARIVVAILLASGLLAGGAVVVAEVRDGGTVLNAGDERSQGEDASANASDSQETVIPPSPAVQAQLDYVLAHWKDYNTAEYGVVPGNDCVDFASQSLIVRGWTMDDQWWAEGTGDDFDFSSPWVSSTAFRDYLEESGRATALEDTQRAEVKLGDIVQFDWDNSGDRDHTAVVSRIDGSGDDIKIYYAGHTDDTDYRSVDWAITVKHPGATVYYWSIPD